MRDEKKPRIIMRASDYFFHAYFKKAKQENAYRLFSKTVYPLLAIGLVIPHSLLFRESMVCFYTL
jgi:hypothetical protein